MLKTRHQIRQHIRTKRKDLSEAHQDSYSRHLVNQLQTHPRLKQAKNVALYLPNDGELCTHSLINWCWLNNINTYLPVLHPFSPGNLLFIHYHEETEMEANKYGIKQPKLDKQAVLPKEQLDIIFTPLVAFDHSGNRLGMGGGYYDRTLASWFKDNSGPYPIGLAHDLQCLEQLPAQSWDVPLPEVITPSKVWRW